MKSNPQHVHDFSAMSPQHLWTSSTPTGTWYHLPPRSGCRNPSNYNCSKVFIVLFGMIKLNTCCYDCLGSTSLTPQPALGAAFQLGHMDFYPDGGKSSWGNILKSPTYLWSFIIWAPWMLINKQQCIINKIDINENNANIVWKTRMMAAIMVEKQNK